MSYIDRNLLDDEQIVYRTKKHFIIFLGPVFWTFVALFCHFNSNSILVNIAFAPAIIAVAMWGYQGLNYLTSEFAVTNKRVLMKEGFFFRHANELRLTTISNISVVQSLIGQALNYGTVVINPFGGNNDVFTLIAELRQFEKAANEQLDKVTRQPPLA